MAQEKEGEGRGQAAARGADGRGHGTDSTSVGKKHPQRARLRFAPLRPSVPPCRAAQCQGQQRVGTAGGPGGSLDAAGRVIERASDAACLRERDQSLASKLSRATVAPRFSAERGTRRCARTTVFRPFRPFRRSGVRGQARRGAGGPQVQDCFAFAHCSLLIAPRHKRRRRERQRLIGRLLR